MFNSFETYYLTDDHCVIRLDYPDYWSGTQSLFKTEKDNILVSTVFLGLPHPDGMFETMIFGGPYDQEMIRSNTYNEAQLVHTSVIEFLDSLNWFELNLDGNIVEKKPLKSITYKSD